MKTNDVVRCANCGCKTVVPPKHLRWHLKKGGIGCIACYRAWATNRLAELKGAA